MNIPADDIVKTIENLRPLNDADFYVNYVNERGVPVKRRVRIAAEQVDHVAVRSAA